MLAGQRTSVAARWWPVALDAICTFLAGDIVEASATTHVSQSPRWYLWFGLAFLIAGLVGHVLAARAIGGSYVAYRDHLAGFIVLTVVSGAVLALAGRRFWRGRSELTVLLLGALQAVLGLVVYIERFSVHG